MLTDSLFCSLLGFGGKSYTLLRRLVPLKLCYLIFEIDNSQDTAYRTNLVRKSSTAIPPHGLPLK